MPSLSIDGVNVVIKGHFNAAIFSPAWLLSQGIIGQAEYDDSDTDIITRDLAAVRCGWLRCQVTSESLQVGTADSIEFERTRDAAVAILRALPHTPISALGLNREVHFFVQGLDQWHAVGDALAPKTVWHDVLDNPGMRSYIVWGVRPDRYTGRVQVQIEPSFQVPQAVNVGINDHFDLTIKNANTSATEDRNSAWIVTDSANIEATANKIPLALSILAEQWQASMKRSEQYIVRVAAQAEVVSE